MPNQSSGNGSDQPIDIGTGKRFTGWPVGGPHHNIGRVRLGGSCRFRAKAGQACRRRRTGQGAPTGRSGVLRPGGVIPSWRARDLHCGENPCALGTSADNASCDVLEGTGKHRWRVDARRACSPVIFGLRRADRNEPIANLPGRLIADQLPARRKIRESNPCRGLEVDPTPGFEPAPVGETLDRSNP